MIGTGRSGTVWLAVHLGLEEYRAIKCILRRGTNYETVRREALILKNLRHPAIPIVYDLEEDQDYLYLIEEYLQEHLFIPWFANRASFGRRMRSVTEFSSANWYNSCIPQEKPLSCIWICSPTI